MTISHLQAPHSDRMPPPSAPEAVVMRFAGDFADWHPVDWRSVHAVDRTRRQRSRQFPDFPAEIWAPEGTTFGVSAFQINFGSTSIHTAG